MTTDTEARDPVAVLSLLIAKRDSYSGELYVGASTARRARKMLRALAEQGYVLVNAEGLALAMEADGWEFNGDPVLGAAAILAAIQEQAGGER